MTDLEQELTDALAGDDPGAALDALAARHAGDEAVLRQIRAARDVLGELSRLGSTLRSEPVPPLRPLGLPLAAPRPSRRRTAWRIALPAAAAVAAAVLLALLARGPDGPPPGPQREIASRPAESQSPYALPAFSMPDVSAPSWPVLEAPDISEQVRTMTFSVPAFTWPSMTERSSDHET